MAKRKVYSVEKRSSDETEEKGPGAAPFEGEGGTDTGSPHETTPNAEQDEDDPGHWREQPRGRAATGPALTGLRLGPPRPG